MAISLLEGVDLRIATPGQEIDHLRKRLLRTQHPIGQIEDAAGLRIEHDHAATGVDTHQALRHRADRIVELGFDQRHVLRGRFGERLGVSFGGSAGKGQLSLQALALRDVG